ncbi:MAG: arginine--tRNA ligase [Candidatus Hepatoplasma scabrum]|nr:MAG: arginine--tRNA ligase [Candidatus Hepatoplasma sp.]
MKEEIIFYLQKYLNDHKISFPKEKIFVFVGKNKQFGDFNTNIAILLANKNKKDAIKIANNIKDFLLNFNYFSDITVTEPGFINFFFKKEQIIKKALLYFDKNYQEEFNTILKQKINYEFVSANPTGYLHLGHARNAIIGETTVMLLDYIGHNVTREYYINDGGNQIDNLAKAIYYYALKKLNIKNDFVKSSEYNGYEIIDYANYLAKKEQKLFYLKEQEQIIKKLKKLAIKHYLSEIKKDLNSLMVADFDIYTSDQKLFDDKKVDEILKNLQKTEYFYEKDGATWLNTSAFFDTKDRVLIKSDGSFTYMVADIANHVQKYQRGFDLMINLWGADHHGYEKRIKSGLQILGYDANKLKIDYITIVKLLENGQEFKMSKRKGTAIKIREILEKVDLGVFKFSILAKGKSQMHAIDIAKINKKDINNIYWYIQYANSRIHQLLKKAGQERLSNLELKKNYKYLGEDAKEEQLLSKMTAFHDQVLQASLNREPLILTNYLKELAQIFHSYYNNCKIISSNKEQEHERLILIVALKNLFARIFNILKIEIIEKM